MGFSPGRPKLVLVLGGRILNGPKISRLTVLVFFFALFHRLSDSTLLPYPLSFLLCICQHFT